MGDVEACKHALQAEVTGKRLDNDAANLVEKVMATLRVGVLRDASKAKIEAIVASVDDKTLKLGADTQGNAADFIDISRKPLLGAPYLLCAVLSGLVYAFYLQICAGPWYPLLWMPVAIPSSVSELYAPVATVYMNFVVICHV